MTQSTANKAHLKGLSGTFKGSDYFLEKEEFIVGRSPRSDMVINEDTISGRHAKIIKGEEHYEIQDLNSSNGTFVNDERISQKILRTGDKIRFDIYEFQFIDPLDVPRTVLVDSADDETIEKTIISPAARGDMIEERTMKLPTQEETVQLPAHDQTIPLPVEEERTEPLKDKQAQRPKQPAPLEKTGSLYAGLFLGIFLALIIGYTISFLGTWAAVNFASLNIPQLILGTINIYPLNHIPTLWLDVQFNIYTIIIIAGIILALIFGGFITQKFSRRSRIIVCFFFAVFYPVIILAAQLAAMKFRFTTFKSLYTSAGIGPQDPLINLAFTIGSIFVVSFIFSFIGSLFSKK